MKGLKSGFLLHWNRILRLVMPVLIWNVFSVTLMASQHDEELFTESWMTTPFEVEVENKDICVEQWMKTPFDVKYAETGPEYELWMGIPFEGILTEGFVRIESWMIKPFTQVMADDTSPGDVRVYGPGR